MPSYLAVLRTPQAARAFSAALIGRLSYGVVFLSLVLSVTQATGSYTVAGTFTALFGLTSSFLSPLRARLIDRCGLRRALVPLASAYALLLTLIAAVTWRPGPPNLVLWSLAVTAGALTPPLGPIMRALWTDLMPTEELRQRAFSLDTVCEELLYVTGPLLAGLFAAVANPALGVAVSAALVLTGSILLAGAPTSPPAPPPISQPAPPPARGPVPVVLAPVLVSAAAGLSLGALSLLVVAFADRTHHIAAVAWLEAALAVGSVTGGLVHGAIRWRSPGERRLPLLAFALGLSLAAAGLAGNLWALAALVAVTGLFLSPALTTAYLIADSAAPPGARVQAGTWVNAAYNLANSLGAASIGLLIGRFPLSVCFAFTAAPAILVAVLTIGSFRRAAEIDRFAARAYEGTRL
ncbi:MFS transporter [Paractinoplanes atraurantiacus]|uniref:Predicted arabinose efflux permease, MFS family n=1 Tax=Paractinoplanes atraurantiacus TaxID=1036182 RepID=A0A285ID89_9ACTN|nr:MFS transporter [Actinoplanes atraurantiacus]SNY45935.1 Predicted arabinose efflux permease, MFS family [Actinoplanes atraurantiacus]